MNGRPVPGDGARHRRPWLTVSPGAALAVLLATGCATTPPPPKRTVPEAARLGEDHRRNYLEALEKAAAGDPSGALRSLSPLLAVRPLHVPSHLLRQDLVRTSGSAEDPGTVYGDLAASLPGDADAALLAVRAMDGPLEERIRGYDDAAALSATAPWPRIAAALARAERARQLDLQGEERAREGFRDEQTALRQAATAAMERARVDAGNAVTLAPDLAASHAALGFVEAVASGLRGLDPALRRSTLDRSLDAYGAALERDPGDGRVLMARAVVLRGAGNRTADALADARAAVAARPGDPEAHLVLARTLGDGGLPEAAEAWSEVVRLRPGDGEALVEWGRSLLAAGRFEDALEVFDRADRTFTAAGEARWRALRGKFTTLAQQGLDLGDEGLLRRARDVLAEYRAARGPDTVWADNMEKLLPAPK